MDAKLFPDCILATARGILNEGPDDEVDDVADMLRFEESALLNGCSRLGILVAAPAAPSGKRLAQGCSEVADEDRLIDLGLSVSVLEEVK